MSLINCYVLMYYKKTVMCEFITNKPLRVNVSLIIS